MHRYWAVDARALRAEHAADVRAEQGLLRAGFAVRGWCRGDGGRGSLLADGQLDRRPLRLRAGIRSVRAPPRPAGRAPAEAWLENTGLHRALRRLYRDEARPRAVSRRTRPACPG